MQGGTHRVWTAAVRLDNADGSWLGHLTGYHVSGYPGGEEWQQGILTGTEAYEGLTAMVFFDHPRTGDSRIHGVIFSGGMPEAPDYPEPAE
jgi:hypothetical protein